MSWGHNRVLQAGGLRQQMYYLPILEAGSPKSRCGQAFVAPPQLLENSWFSLALQRSIPRPHRHMALFSLRASWPHLPSVPAEASAPTRPEDGLGGALRDDHGSQQPKRPPGDSGNRIANSPGSLARPLSVLEEPGLGARSASWLALSSQQIALSPRDALRVLPPLDLTPSPPPFPSGLESGWSGD